MTGPIGRGERRPGRPPTWAKQTQHTSKTPGSSDVAAATISERQPEKP